MDNRNCQSNGERELTALRQTTKTKLRHVENFLAVCSINGIGAAVEDKCAVAAPKIAVAVSQRRDKGRRFRSDVKRRCPKILG